MQVQLNRRSFICGMVAAGTLPSVSAGDSRIARVGLMTDTHVGTTMESCSRVRAALELFKARGAEMVVNCGDIANRHYPDGYRCYRKVVNEVYPDPASRPVERFVYAFHDVVDYRPGVGWGCVERDAASAFADVHRLLEAPNTHTDSLEWKGMSFLNFPQSTGKKGFLTWTDYEAAIRKACEAHPGKPVFVLDHLPPAGTTFHSRQWGSENCRRVLNKFPQVVSISGHVHGSLASERQIWQGEFTAVNAACLQTWGGFAPGSTPPPQAKQSFGVLLMDIYADRLVFARLDVRDGSELGPQWVVPLPFAARSAPYAPAAAAARVKRLPAFGADAAVSVAKVGGGYAVEFPEATKPDPFMYRISVERKDASGEWVGFTRDDVFSEFWKSARERTGRARHVVPSGLFTPGEAYRVSVSPLDHFYRASRPIYATFTATHKSTVVWSLADPMRELRFTEWGKPVNITMGGRFAPSSGQGTLWLPENAFAKLAGGVRHHLVLDLDAIQPDGEWCAWRVCLRPRAGGSSIAEVQSAPGEPGVLRYAFVFTPPKDGSFPASCNLIFNYQSPGSSFRVAGIRIVRDDA